MRLVRPSASYLSGYLAAAERGWSSETATLDPEAAAAECTDIRADPDRFIAEMNDLTRLGRPVVLPSGDSVPRLPGLRRWMWDGDFCGVIGVRWQPGTTDLPPHCLGHIGYAVVPWKRRLGYASQALAQVLPLAQEQGLPYVDIVTDTDNVASQRVVLANGGELVRTFTTPPSQGEFTALLFRIRFEPLPG